MIMVVVAEGPSPKVFASVGDPKIDGQGGVQSGGHLLAHPANGAVVTEMVRDP